MDIFSRRDAGTQRGRGFSSRCSNIIPGLLHILGKVTNGGPLRGVWVGNSRLGKSTRMNCGAQPLPKEYNESAFSSDFVNRSAKPPAFVKKGDISLNGPPFVTVPSIPAQSDKSQGSGDRVPST